MLRTDYAGGVDAPLPDPPTPPDAPAPARPWLRPLLTLGLFAALVALAHATGQLDELSPAGIRALIARAGPLAAVAFVAVYAGGNLLQLPGWVFIGAGVLAWGRPVAFGLSYLSSVLAALVAFVGFRRAAAQPLRTARRPWVQRLLDGIEARPFRVMLVLRVLFAVSPPLNFALALTPVRLRDYLAATMAGIVIPVGFMVVAYGWLFDAL